MIHDDCCGTYSFFVPKIYSRLTHCLQWQAWKPYRRDMADSENKIGRRSIHFREQSKYIIYSYQGLLALLAKFFHSTRALNLNFQVYCTTLALPIVRFCNANVLTPFQQLLRADATVQVEFISITKL